MTLDDLEKCVSGETVLKYKDYSDEIIYIHHNNKCFNIMYTYDGTYECYQIKDLHSFEIKKQKLYAYTDGSEVVFYTKELSYTKMKRFPEADREI
jgi:hypothetical protein